MPPQFVCPITKAVMTEPVIAPDNQLYDRSAIELHFQSHKTSPLTQQALDRTELIPATNLKKLIDDWWEAFQKQRTALQAATQL